MDEFLIYFPYIFCTKSGPQKWINFFLLTGWWGPIQITNGKNFIQKLMWCGYTICLTNWRAKYCTRTRRVRHMRPPSEKCDTWKTVSFNSILPTPTLPLPQIRLLRKAQQRQLNRIYMLSLNFNVNLSDIDGICFLFGKLGFQIWKALGEKICKSRHDSSSCCTDK